ncbi:tetratricopeptide repeat protein [Kitasatospora sp. NBC_00085]|uniref:tetratricopeptide repeat protein n=1 Tax=unclassified Kitasatospora TaxID=2633591 RepID=UPI0032536396
MERVRLAGVNGPGGNGSGYAVGGRLVLSSAHVTGPPANRVEVFHPGGTGTATGRVVWSGTSGGRDDASLVLVHDSPHWQPPSAPVRWGRAVTDRPGIPCETWGTPDVAQRPDRALEAEQLRGRLNPGSGFVGNQHVIDLDQHPARWPADGTSPFGGMSGAAVFCDRLLTGVVTADRAHSGHGRLNAVPAYVLQHDPAFRAALAEYDVGPSGGLQAVEFQDLADRAQDHDLTPRLPSPAVLLQARHQIVPFHGRHDLLTEMTAWCRLGGFGAWLLHGPGGQGKTRLAHHLAHLLAAEGWAVLWPRTTATADQLREVRPAAKPLLVVLDYAESRADQIAALVEAAADHPATTPLKLLLLARTDGDWWHQATAATSLAEDYLTTARTHHLTPLDDHPAPRADRYRDAVRALADTLPRVDGLLPHDWSAAAVSLPSPDLDPKAYGNALTLHMTALADLLDTADPRPPGQSWPADRGAVGQEADLVEDRLLTHERRHWRQTVLAIAPALSLATLETALAADREQADRLWQRLPVLDGQSRDRRNRVTTWLATLYPAPAPGGSPWGTFQPDRLAERHIGRVLDTDPDLADHLLNGADDTQSALLLTVYSRAASHPVFHDRLNTQLTALCVRHHRQLASHVVTVVTRTSHPQPLITALDTIAVDPATPPRHLAELYDLFPYTSQRLAAPAIRIAHGLVTRFRALADEDPARYQRHLAVSLNNLGFRLGDAGLGAEGLAASREAVSHYRVLAKANPAACLPGLAQSLDNLSNRLAEVGLREESLTASQEAVIHFRELVEANPAIHLADLASALNNLSLRLGGVGRHEDALAASREASAIRRTLARANHAAHLPNHAQSLINLSTDLLMMGRWEESLAAVQEATGHYRALAETDLDAYQPDLAAALHTFANALAKMGRAHEALAASQEATGHYRALVKANPAPHLPDLAQSLNNTSLRLGEVGRWVEGLAAIQEAIAIRRSLTDANRATHLPDLATDLNNISVRFGQAGQWEKALAAAQEAVGHFRALTETNPAAHLPHLASALSNLSLSLQETGQLQKALAASQEATGHGRTLALANPAAHLPDLAQFLNNLSILLREAGWREEALAAIQEAVAIRRSLTDANRAAHLPDLAQSLNNLSVHLADVGRQKEGLAAIQEAVNHYRVLARANPTIHLPNLAQSLDNLSLRLRGTGRRKEALAAAQEAGAVRRAHTGEGP